MCFLYPGFRYRIQNGSYKHTIKIALENLMFYAPFMNGYLSNLILRPSKAGRPKIKYYKVV